MAILGFSGCAWQRIPAPPPYHASIPIPIRAGVVLGDNPESHTYGPGVVKHLKEMRVFEAVHYPYRKGDPVDAILKVTITGGWKQSTAGNFAKGLAIGVTLFILSPVIGPSMYGFHDVHATLYSGLVEYFSSTIHIKTGVSFGLAANTNEVAVKADELQMRKIAVEVANRVNQARSSILAEVGRSYKRQRSYTGTRQYDQYRRQSVMVAPQEDPYQLTIHKLGKRHGGKRYAIEVRPNGERWSPFIAAIPLNERDHVSPKLRYGPVNRIPSQTNRINAGESESKGGRWWVVYAGKEATPTQSYYIFCNRLPSLLIFGVDGGSPQYKVRF